MISFSPAIELCGECDQGVTPNGVECESCDGQGTYPLITWDQWDQLEAHVLDAFSLEHELDALFNLVATNFPNQEGELLTELDQIMAEFWLERKEEDESDADI